MNSTFAWIIGAVVLVMILPKLTANPAIAPVGPNSVGFSTSSGSVKFNIGIPDVNTIINDFTP